MKKFKNKIWAQLLVIYTRFILGGTFVFASIIKLKGKRFTTDSGADFPIDSAWHFFETLYQSGLYWKFIGFGQLVAGFLLMTQRYSKLGALLFLPILANVFVITLSYYFAYTPVITGMMLLANIMLVAWDWNELKMLINLQPDFEPPKGIESDVIWERTGVVLFVFTVVYRLLEDNYDIFLWGVICALIGLSGMILGIRKTGILDANN